LKTSVHVDLPAVAERVVDLDERRRVLTAPHTAYYRDAVSLDAALAHSPMVRVQFTGDAAWLADAVRSGRPRRDRGWRTRPGAAPRPRVGVRGRGAAGARSWWLEPGPIAGAVWQARP